jgi:hypothetical protein
MTPPQPGGVFVRPMTTNGERLVRLETILNELRDDMKTLLLDGAAHKMDDKIRFEQVDKSIGALKSRMDWGGGAIATLLLFFTFFGDALRAQFFGR